MYYVNREQIAQRLRSVPDVAGALRTLAFEWNGTLLQGLAQERALHLAIEIVTDVGSCLIDGFIMRDASSYEDIVEITGGEGVFPEALKETLLALVRLRKALVQDYYDWPRAELHPLTAQISEGLPAFKEAVESYLERELA
ncbi:hypothetical protein BG53_12915 [Paenibacillus darwinianus]|uniref:DUF86 domain-containing protein n=1 Tax=Paenibacillus darwinianus TaxID=1380763 RepID=A0A9W5S2W2_9BACL|nr:HepT-like ribonuclease domain-containing protein [Paenibacillus darwinianus]EXX89441.1 hypothetical protein CH50_01480 [Paenibacillus darwinianus]EXX90785.1 hypothetical protein BG53_12915 [Paenibacillus darwinianus]EXX90841.1 hypothetical protein BG52_12020 [Paenibacillus darwinianus]